MIYFLSLISLLGALFLAGCGQQCCDHTGPHTHEKTTATTQHSAVIEVTNANDFESIVLKSDKPVVVDFSAIWCGACQVMKPRIEELAEELKEKYKFVMVDVDKAGDIAQKYEIKGIPAFLLFKDGKEINANDRIAGDMSKEEFKTKIDKAFGQ